MHDYPTNGIACDPSGVDARKILAENLGALMRHAKDMKRPELASVKGLSKASTVSRPSIDEILEGKRSAGLDKIELIAAAFEVQAWTLLLPHLDPTDVPTRAEDLEQELYDRIGVYLKRQRQRMRKRHGKEVPSGGDRPDDHHKGAVGGKKGEGTKKT